MLDNASFFFFSKNYNWYQLKLILFFWIHFWLLIIFYVNGWTIKTESVKNLRMQKCKRIFSLILLANLLKIKLVCVWSMKYIYFATSGLHDCVPVYYKHVNYCVPFCCCLFLLNTDKCMYVVHVWFQAASSALSSLGHVYTAIGDYPNALASHKQCVLLARQSQCKLSEARQLGNMGAVYTALGDFTNAVQCHEQHLDIAKV